MSFNVIYLQLPRIIVITQFLLVLTFGQDANIVLKQGTIVGLKVFPETSKSAVFTYLGIPYAEPPVGRLRFSRPHPNNGWNNRTLFARDYKPICPQIEQNIYEETNEGIFSTTGVRTSEDCLYLNIWTPEAAFRYGNLPVLVIITGEEMAFDWRTNRISGLDLSSEGIVVVTIQYRTNILGWLSLDNAISPGNLGLWDQNLALVWIKENIQKFGGDTKRVTLLGHGTSGAANVMIHLVSKKAKDLFSKMIIMSGTIFSSYSFQRYNRSSTTPTISNQIIRNLVCESSNSRAVLECMRKKSLDDLMKAFENVYKNGNYTNVLGPVIDDYLKLDQQYITDDPRKLIRINNFNKIPIMIGICNNEGAFIRDYWIDLSKQGYKILKNYIDKTVVSNVMEHFTFPGFGQKQVRETISWRFFDQIPKTTVYLMNALQTLISETKYELPFYETIEILTTTNNNLILTNNNEYNNDDDDELLAVSNLTNETLTDINGNNKIIDQQNNMKIEKLHNSRIIKRKVQTTHSSSLSSSSSSNLSLFVYSFQQSNSIDMRGKINYFDGASHSSDLPYLLGPSLFQQISRRRLTQTEEKVCRKMRQLFGEFIKSGNPTPGRLYDKWHTYTNKHKYIKIIGSKTDNSLDTNQPLFGFEHNLGQIEQMLSPSTTLNVDSAANTNPYNLNNKPSGELGRKAKNNDYLTTETTSEYYIYLTKVYSFWMKLLPKIYKNLNEIDEETKRDINDKSQVQYFDQNSSKFKHAFFSMLTLVCLLLAILCICVYILKKNGKHLDTSVL